MPQAFPHWPQLTGSPLVSVQCCVGVLPHQARFPQHGDEPPLSPASLPDVVPPLELLPPALKLPPADWVPPAAAVPPVFVVPPLATLPPTALPPPVLGLPPVDLVPPAPKLPPCECELSLVVVPPKDVTPPALAAISAFSRPERAPQAVDNKIAPVGIKFL